MADKYWREDHRSGVTLGCSIPLNSKSGLFSYSENLHTYVTLGWKDEDDQATDPRESGAGFLGKMFKK